MIFYIGFVFYWLSYSGPLDLMFPKTKTFKLFGFPICRF